MRVLMVCLGNICRSPLAEGILRAKVETRGLDWKIDSAGTGDWHIGEGPDPRSIDTARKNGIDISGQRARQFRKADLREFDLILAMDQENYRNVIRMAESEEERKKVEMIMNFVQPGQNESVPDPYWNDDGFDRVYAMLEEACERLVLSVEC